MSLKDCIDSAVTQGHMTSDEAASLKKKYDAIAKRTFATGKVKEELVAEIAAEIQQRQRVALITASGLKKIDAAVLSHRNFKGEVDIAEAAMWLYEHKGEAKFMDAATLEKTIYGKAVSDLDGFLHEFRRGAVVGDLRRTSKLVGNRKTQARIQHVVDELYGLNSKDANAKALAEAYAGVAESMRVRFNDAGGAIGKLENRGPPQWHDAQALLNYGSNRWVDRMMQPGELNREKMTHPLTKRVLSDGELREGLAAAWLNITTESWSGREATGAPVGKGALWKQHADHRFLHFKDGAAWMRYAKDFGNPDVIGAMLGELKRMARDIARMETFGPNPEVGRTYLKNLLRKHANTVKPFEQLIVEKSARLVGIQDKLKAEQQALVERLKMLPIEMRMVREKRPGNISRRGKGKLAELHQEFKDVLDQLSPGLKSTVSSNPALALEFKTALDDLDSIAEIPFAATENPAAYAEHMIGRMDDMWLIMRGTLSAPTVGVTANVLQSARNLVTASSLGAAQLSALSDVAFGGATRKFVGMARNKSSVYRTLIETLKYIGTDNKREAVRSGLILDSALHAMHQQARYTGSMDTRSITGFMADRTIAASGLSAWTQAGKHAFGMAIQGLFADHAKMTWGQLPDAVRQTLERHGIVEKGNGVTWDMIRRATQYEPKPGAVFLRAREIEATAGREAAEKYHAMILRETTYAVPEGTVRSQSILMGNTRPGTLTGEIARNFAQFKGFAFVVPMLQMSRVASERGAGRGTRAAQYAASLFITSTILAALVIALKDISKGRDPRAVTDDETYLDPAFWGAAILQGGGLGIYGDFLFANVNRFGGGISTTAAGPVVGRIGNLWNLTGGNLIQLAGQDPTNFGREGVRFLRENTPGGSLWYLRLAYERVVLDELQKLVDPEAHSAFQRQISKRESDYKQGHWWAPGKPRPDHAPDLGAFFGK